MLTKGLDNFSPSSTGTSQTTAGNDTIIGSIDTGTSELNTLSPLDIIDGGAGIDTLKIADALGNPITLGNVTNVEIVEVQGAKNVDINTTSGTGVTNLNVTKAALHATNDAVKATAAATTDINVSMKAAGDTVAVIGGKNVTVKLTDVAANADTVTIGGAAVANPKGDVVVEMTGKAATADVGALSTVNVTGGKTISVTQKAVGEAAAVASSAAGFTVTQGAVNVTGNADTTTVTVKQDAAVAKVGGAAAVAAKAATQEVTFTEAEKGDTVTLHFGAGGQLTFTAKKYLTAAEVASAFANLATGALQGNASATLGIYTDAAGGVTNKWSSGAVQAVDATKSKVVFSTSGLVAGAGAQPPTTGIVATKTGTVVLPTVAAAVHGVNEIKAVTGVLGVANGKVVIEDSAAATIKTITVDGYATASTIGTGTLTTVLETLNLSNSGHTFNATGQALTTADIVVDDTAATLALNLEKVGTANEAAAGNGVAAITLTAAPTTLNVKSTGANYVELDAGETENLNVSGNGLLTVSAASAITGDLSGLKAVKVTETAGLDLTGVTLTALTSVDTTGTTGTTTVAIKGDLATYAGGAGVDNVTVTNPGTAISKAIDLGAGNDRLDLSAATPVTPTVVLNGGTGDDTIVLKSADAASLSAGTAFAAKIDGFEKLEVKQALANATDEINLSNLDDIKYVISNGQLAGADAKEVQTLTVATGVTATKTNATQTIDFAGVAAGADGVFTVGGIPVNVLALDSPAAIAGKVAVALSGQKPTVGLAVTTENVKAEIVAPATTVVTITYDTRDGAPAAQLAVVNGTATLAAGFPAATTAGTTFADNNQTITVGGVTVSGLVANHKAADGTTVAFGDDTAAEVAAAIKTAFAGNAAYTSVTNVAGSANVVFTFADFGNKDPLTIAGAGGVTGTFAETTPGKFATEQTLKNMLDGGTLEMLAAATSTVVTMKDATGSTDSFNIVTKAVNAANLGTVKVEGVETLNITTVDTDATVPGVSTNSLTLSGNKAQTITVKGDGNLSLTLAPASTEVKLIDASTLKGALTVITLAGDTAATTVKGGSAADTLTAAGANDVLIGGAGNDTLKVTTGSAVTLTGGDGIDAFDVSGFKGTVGGAATITDFTKGETIKFVANANADFNSGKVTLIAESTFTEYVNEAMKVASANGTLDHGVSWFQFNNNTFVVQNIGADNTFNDGTDIIVKITGAVDLSASSFNEFGQGTLLFI